MSTAVKTFKRRGSRVWLDKTEYRGFLIGNLPARFAFIYNEDKEQDGVTSWFNHKGWTFINNDALKTGW